MALPPPEKPAKKCGSMKPVKILVQPDLVAAAAFTQVGMRLAMEGIILNDPVPLDQLVAQHAAQLRVGVRTMGTKGIEERDIPGRYMLQLTQHGGDEQVAG